MMTTVKTVHIASRDNPLFKSLRKLVQTPSAYRKLGKIWIEGDHLCRAALSQGVRPSVAVFSQNLWQQGIPQEWRAGLTHIHVLDDALFAQISPLESAGQMGYVLNVASLQQTQAIQPHANTVILDCIQDAGNVGSILRTASAMGFKQILAVKGTAALWSPKVLRAGMGAHFALQLFEDCTVQSMNSLRVPLLVTHLQGQTLLHQAMLPSPCAWIFGHEGRGVDSHWVQCASQVVRIAQPGGEESLNVAAAAAICLFASVSQPSNSVPV